MSSAKKYWSMKFLYLFINIPYLWRCKIGISKDVSKRRKTVNNTTPGWSLPVWVVFVPFAGNIEKQLHHFFQAFNCPFRMGSGRSEWFLTLPVLPLAWVLLNFMFVIYWSPVWLLVYWLYIETV
jgi:hypothetical protein